MSENGHSNGNGNGSRKGRPTKLTPEIQRKICEKLEKGLSQESALKACGIAHSTFYDWMHNSDFSDEVKGSQVKAEEKLLGRIVKASNKDWKAAAWLLERRCPRLYARLEALALAERINEETKREVVPQDRLSEYYGIFGVKNHN